MLSIIINVVTCFLAIYVALNALACMREQRRLQSRLADLQFARAHFSSQISQLETLLKESGIIESNPSIHDALQSQSKKDLSSAIQKLISSVSWPKNYSLILQEEDLDDLDSIVSKWDKNALLAYFSYANAIGLTKKEHIELLRHTLSRKSQRLRHCGLYGHRAADLYSRVSEPKWEEDDYYGRICNA